MYRNKKEIDKAIANHTFSLSEVPPDERMKYEIAQELHYFDKVLDGGWGALTAQESGRIGGILHKRKREQAKEE
ncbi:MAG: small, acid-soluble spore protein, alpha/beta type [Lachnospiraceae bacterium]